MVRHHRRIAPAIALTLALAAAAPADAKFDLNPPAGTNNPSTTATPNLCSEVCSASGSATHKAGATLPHDPRARAVALAGAAIPQDPRVRAVALAGAGYGYGSTPGAHHVTATPLPTPVGGGQVIPTRTAASNDGFDWGDAGIGAGAAMGLMTLLVGGALGVTGARRRAARRTA